MYSKIKILQMTLPYSVQLRCSLTYGVYSFLLAAPHQPRLDWQMWFAALGSYQHNPWLVHLVYRLLIGQKEGVYLQ